jgi:hypothetical protein
MRRAARKRQFGRKPGIVMRATLRHRASDTYYGQWLWRFAGKTGPKTPVQCPE